MTQIKKTLKLNAKRRPLRIHKDLKGRRYIKVNNKRYYLADNVKGDAKKEAYKLLRNLIGETIEKRLKKSYRKATKIRKPMAKRRPTTRKPKKTKEPKQEPQATPTYNPFAPNLSSVMAPVMRNPMQTYNLFLPGGLMETVRAQLEDVKKGQLKLIENKEQKLLMPPVGTPPKSPRKITPLSESSDIDLSEMNEKFLRGIEEEMKNSPVKPKKLLDRVKDALTGKKEEKQEEEKKVNVDLGLSYQPLPVGQKDVYYATVIYEDEDGNETKQNLRHPLPLSASEFQKANNKLYKEVVNRKKSGKSSVFNEGDAGFTFFRNYIKPNDPKKKIVGIEISNKSVAPRGDGRKTEGEGGLYDDEINAKMKHWQHFQGTIMRDELGEFFDTALKNDWDRFGVIVNTDVTTGPGEHWTAIFVDLYKDRSIEYFDPFGDPPHETIEHDIKKYIEALDLPFMLKYKVNSNKLQHEKSDRCGLHAMLFLEDRFRGIPFGEATGYEKKDSLITKSEARAERRKKGFGYV